MATAGSASPERSHIDSRRSCASRKGSAAMGRAVVTQVPDAHRRIPASSNPRAIKADVDRSNEAVVDEPAFLENDDACALSHQMGQPSPPIALVSEALHRISLKPHACRWPQYPYHLALRHAQHHLSGLGKVGTPRDAEDLSKQHSRREFRPHTDPPFAIPSPPPTQPTHP